jgi:hypothetical protein
MDLGYFIISGVGVTKLVVLPMGKHRNVRKSERVNLGRIELLRVRAWIGPIPERHLDERLGWFLARKKGLTKLTVL